MLNIIPKVKSLASKVTGMVPKLEDLSHNQVFIAMIVGIIVFLGWMFHNDPTLPIAEITGSALHHTGLLLVIVVSTLWSLGGKGWDAVEQLKTNLTAYAIVVASIIVGCAITLGH